MANTATIYRYQLELSDIDRGVYESMVLRVARHPSEDEERMVVRMLARAIAHEEGLEFGRGLSNVEDAALWTHAPTGEVATWIDVGLPAADRLHRANKHASKLLVFTHKSEASLRKEWSTRKIHRAETIQVYRLPPELVRDLAQDIARKMTWYVTIQGEVVSIADGERSVEGTVEQISLANLISN